jgi:hypothetical protein
VEGAACGELHVGAEVGVGLSLIWGKEGEERICCDGYGMW